MIEFKDVGVRRDGRELFAGASFQLHPGHKVGLTGNNGTGKSTLFALLLTRMGRGDTEVTLDRGEVSIPDSWHVAHMAQEVGATTQSAIDYVLSGDEQWYEINASLNDLSSVMMSRSGYCISSLMKLMAIVRRLKRHKLWQVLVLIPASMNCQ